MEMCWFLKCLLNGAGICLLPWKPHRGPILQWNHRQGPNPCPGYLSLNQSTNGHWCQFNADKSPQLGLRWRKKRDLVQNSSIRYSTALETAWQWGGPGPGLSQARRLCTDLLDGLLCSFHAGLFPSALARHLLSQEDSAFSLWWKGKGHSTARGELSYMDTLHP